MSGLQNVRSSKRPIEKKHPYIFCTCGFCYSRVCRQSDGCVLFSVFEGFLPDITIISNNDTLIALNRNANLAISILLFYKYIKFKAKRFEIRRFETWRFVNLTFCKPDILKPDVLKPDVLKPDVLKPDVLWVYPLIACPLLASTI